MTFLRFTLHVTVLHSTSTHDGFCPRVEEHRFLLSRAMTEEKSAFSFAGPQQKGGDSSAR